MKITGKVVHPGSAKNRMRNAALLACEFAALLPATEIPATTEGREGFFHLGSIEGDVATAALDYIIRDHDHERFEERKRIMEQAAALMNARYGCECVALSITDQYYNMKEQYPAPHGTCRPCARGDGGRGH